MIYEDFIKLLVYLNFTVHTVLNQTLNYIIENYYTDMLNFSSQVYVRHRFTFGAISYSVVVG